VSFVNVRYAEEHAVILICILTSILTWTRSVAMPTARISLLFTVMLAGILCGARAGVALAQAPGEPESPPVRLPAPDYARPDAWAALPGHPSAADAVPPDSDAANLQADAPADLFFVHPTTYMAIRVKNARYDEPGATRERVDFNVLGYDAAAFNACCRLFVPRYRQASIASFLAPRPRSLAAFELAYSDVARAFDYYVSHHNGGRPFIIASHSQGSLHAMRLLQDRIVGTPLQRQLVAAYLIGWAVPEDVERTGLPVCRSALQSGCVIGWNTATPTQTLDFMRGRAVFWLDGRYQLLADKDIVCVNPLTWTKDGGAPAAANLGSLPPSRPGEPLEPTIPELTGAVCEDGVLHVFLPHEIRYFVGYHPNLGSFHRYDYNLFFANIRRNATERVAAFLARRR
jgi:hypothetical protein